MRVARRFPSAVNRKTASTKLFVISFRRNALAYSVYCSDKDVRQGARFRKEHPMVTSIPRVALSISAILAGLAFSSSALANSVLAEVQKLDQATADKMSAPPQASEKAQSSEKALTSEKAVPPPSLDSDNDGKLDAWDRDANGVADAWDINGDGQPDQVDDNGDGKPDDLKNPAPAPEPDNRPK
jgi:hypothetical protein